MWIFVIVSNKSILVIELLNMHQPGCQINRSRRITIVLSVLIFQVFENTSNMVQETFSDVD